jgi:putative membrane protein
VSLPPPLPASLPAGGEDHRLHPWSWLFVLLMQLRHYFLPLVALLVFGQRGDRDPMWAQLIPLSAIAALVLVSVLQYLSYRYRIGSDAITVRSGLLARNRREIPFARIHNVEVRQNPLHRLFGVAELRLESAGGVRPEAEMRVLKLDQALALERLVRQRGQAPQAADAVVRRPLPTSTPNRCCCACRAGTWCAWACSPTAAGHWRSPPSACCSRPCRGR